MKTPSAASPNSMTSGGSLVPRLAAWLHLADEAAAVKPLLAHVKKARAWLKDVHAELRDTRMSAIAWQAQEIWGI